VSDKVQPNPLGKPVLFGPNGEKTTDGLENSRLWHEWAKETLVEMEDYRRALESLTPGGSEFYKSPARCVEYIRDRFKMGSDAKRECMRLRYLLEDVGDKISATSDASSSTRLKSSSKEDGGTNENSRD
jgi:hypothetical protein